MNGSRSGSIIRSPVAITCGYRAKDARKSTSAPVNFRLAGDTNVHVYRVSTITRYRFFIAPGTRDRSPPRALDQRWTRATIDTPNTQVVFVAARGSTGSTSPMIDSKRRWWCAKVKSRSPSPAARSRFCPARRPTLFGTNKRPGRCAQRQPVSTASTRGAPIETATTAEAVAPTTSRGKMVGYADLDTYGTLAKLSGLRRRLVPDIRRGGLGAVPPRPVGVCRGRFWGWDVGRRGTLGLRPVPLWPLGLCRRGAGAWCPGHVRRSSRMGAGAGSRGTAASGWGVSSSIAAPVYGLGAARLARALHSVVEQLRVTLHDGVQPAVCGQRRRNDRGSRPPTSTTRCRGRSPPLQAQRFAGGKAGGGPTSSTCRDISSLPRRC